MVSLIYLGIVQVGTAIALLIPSVLPWLGMKNLSGEFMLYPCFLASLYFALGALYILGAAWTDFRKAAMTIACVDVVLETASCVLGLPAAHVAYWLVALFSAALLAPGIVCFVRLMQGPRRVERGGDATSPPYKSATGSAIW
jgi:hypothetical protein